MDIKPCLVIRWNGRIALCYCRKESRTDLFSTGRIRHPSSKLCLNAEHWHFWQPILLILFFSSHVLHSLLFFHLFPPQILFSRCHYPCLFVFWMSQLPEPSCAVACHSLFPQESCVTFLKLVISTAGWYYTATDLPTQLNHGLPTDD